MGDEKQKNSRALQLYGLSSCIAHPTLLVTAGTRKGGGGGRPKFRLIWYFSEGKFAPKTPNGLSTTIFLSENFVRKLQLLDLLLYLFQCFLSGDTLGELEFVEPPRYRTDRLTQHTPSSNAYYSLGSKLRTGRVTAISHLILLRLVDAEL